jgi:hypothetical protein
MRATRWRPRFRSVGTTETIQEVMRTWRCFARIGLGLRLSLHPCNPWTDWRIYADKRKEAL